MNWYALKVAVIFPFMVPVAALCLITGVGIIVVGVVWEICELLPDEEKDKDHVLD
jgi:hypothetical protein